MIRLFDEKNNYLKLVYPRYADQCVRKGKAQWIYNNSAIELITVAPTPIPMHAILMVFTKIDDKLSVSSAMTQLVSLFASSPFPKQKAAGALGGASRSGFIRLNLNGEWIRVK